jgi:N-acetylglucosamine kinase-like BadF-type ATPase
MLGAARAVFKDEPGITCVMNTSSATCLYDGESITKFSFNGGYILGDVGSSSELSRLFISDIIKGFVPKDLADEFKKDFDTNLSGLMGMLYNGPAFEALNEAAQFLYEHADNEYVSELIKTNFENFINGNLGNYDELKNQKIRVLGDFAFRFKDILQKVFKEKKIEVDKIIGSAMDGLQEYHINHPIY